jgi:hypothetical protein
MKAKELRSELEKRGLETTGLKPELEMRLRESLTPDASLHARLVFEDKTALHSSSKANTTTKLKLNAALQTFLGRKFCQENELVPLLLAKGACSVVKEVIHKRKVTAKSGYHGVFSTGVRYSAIFNTDGKRFHLGTFDTKQEAALAYDKSVRTKQRHTITNFSTLEEGERLAAVAVEDFIKNRKRPLTKTGFLGVYNNGRKFEGRFKPNGAKIKTLGHYDTKEEAALAYDLAVREDHGIKALCNFSSIAEGKEQAQAAAELFASPRSEAGEPAFRDSGLIQPGTVQHAPYSCTVHCAHMAYPTWPITNQASSAHRPVTSGCIAREKATAGSGS